MAFAGVVSGQEVHADHGGPDPRTAGIWNQCQEAILLCVAAALQGAALSCHPRLYLLSDYKKCMLAAIKRFARMTTQGKYYSCVAEPAKATAIQAKA